MELDPITLEVEIALESDQIGWKESLDRLEPIINGKKAWHTTEWKKERDVLIKSTCEQCGSTKLPMVLQHFYHPMSFWQIFRALCGKNAWPDFKKDYDYILGKDLLVNRPTCPKCGSTNIHKLKSLQWSCYKCSSSHDKPIIKPAFNKQGIMELTKRHKDPELQDKRWRVFKQFYGDKVGKQAVLEFINQSRIYLSLEGTGTFCRKCAFAWDKKGLRLCQSCKENWHRIYSKQCAQCCQQTN